MSSTWYACFLILTTPHFTEKETGTERLRNRPKVTAVIDGRTKIPVEAGMAQDPSSQQCTHCTALPPRNCITSLSSFTHYLTVMKHEGFLRSPFTPSILALKHHLPRFSGLYSIVKQIARRPLEERNFNLFNCQELVYTKLGDMVNYVLRSFSNSAHL